MNLALLFKISCVASYCSSSPEHCKWLLLWRTSSEAAESLKESLVHQTTEQLFC